MHSFLGGRVTININRLSYDSFLVAFMPFLYGICNIFSTIGSVSLGIVLVSFTTILPSVILSGKTLTRVIFLLISIITIVIPQYIIFPQNTEGITSSLIALFSIGFVGLYIGSLKYDIIKVCKYASKLSYLNLIVNIIYLLANRDDIDTLSMRFGYGILPSLIFILYNALEKKRKKDLIISIFISVLILIWGSRGCFIVLLLFLLMYFGKKHFCIIIACIVLCFFGQQYIIQALLSLIEDLPVESYKLNKMMTMLTEGIAVASSGRDTLYSFYYHAICNNPEGLGIGYYTRIGMLYPHNIVLQTGVEFGIIGIFLWLCYELYALLVIYKSPTHISHFLIIIFAIANGRLLVSSNYWERPEWWFLLALIVQQSRNINLKNRAL